MAFVCFYCFVFSLFRLPLSSLFFSLCVSSPICLYLVLFFFFLVLFLLIVLSFAFCLSLISVFPTSTFSPLLSISLSINQSSLLDFCPFPFTVTAFLSPPHALLPLPLPPFPLLYFSFPLFIISIFFTQIHIMFPLCALFRLSFLSTLVHFLFFLLHFGLLLLLTSPPSALLHTSLLFISTPFIFLFSTSFSSLLPPGILFSAFFSSFFTFFLHTILVLSRLFFLYFFVSSTLFTPFLFHISSSSSSTSITLRRVLFSLVSSSPSYSISSILYSLFLLLTSLFSSPSHLPSLVLPSLFSESSSRSLSLSFYVSVSRSTGFRFR